MGAPLTHYSSLAYLLATYNGEALALFGNVAQTMFVS